MRSQSKLSAEKTDEYIDLNDPKKKSSLVIRRENSASPNIAVTAPEPSKYAQLSHLLNASKRAKSTSSRAKKSPATRPSLADRRNDMKAKKAAQVK